VASTQKVSDCCNQCDRSYIAVIYSLLDWKIVVYSEKPSNSGDDIAGIVEEVGEGVMGFSKGDRVAAFHPMGTAHGSFAQYSIAPSHTTFHIPARISFEEVSDRSKLASIFAKQY
jgi:NADPH:quinone reductase-like Zn-dependent oxidoreductase